MKIDFPRASAFDGKIKKYSCEAKLTVGGMYELPIAYESQLDDKNQHIVSVGGIRRADLFALQAGMIEGIRKSRAEKSNVTKPAEAPPIPKLSEQRIPSAAPTGASIEIDIKNEIDLKDGTYLAKEHGGQGRYAFITHSHGSFEGGDIAEAVCTDGFLATNLPDKFGRIKEVLKPTDFVLTKCDEAR
ncbi:MAG: hypothetical protein K2P67_02250 [Gallionellaceae bacterium]|nr:hypothetical protein [Gallionellaceae bacterium]